MVDEDIAVALCYYEVMEMLKNLFCLNHRTARFYCRYDREPAKLERCVTKDLEPRNFEERRNELGEIDVDDLKKFVYHKKNLDFGLFTEFMNYFATIGGFDAIIAAFKFGHDSKDSADKIPMYIFPVITSPFKNCAVIFDPQFAKDFVT